MNLNVDEYLDITTEHRVGLYVPDGGMHPVSTLFAPTAAYLLSSEETGPFTTDDIYTFSDLGNPHTFQIDFCNGAGMLQRPLGWYVNKAIRFII